VPFSSVFPLPFPSLSSSAVIRARLRHAASHVVLVQLNYVEELHRAAQAAMPWWLGGSRHVAQAYLKVAYDLLHKARDLDVYLDSDELVIDCVPIVRALFAEVEKSRDVVVPPRNYVDAIAPALALLAEVVEREL